MGDLVSIIVPAYNAAPFIAETLRSALRQTYTDIEVLVADDASTDDTVRIVQQCAAVDRRVRLLTSPRNSGLPAVARNRAIAEARGPILSFLDADDLWHPSKIAEQMAALHCQPRVSLVYSMLLSIGVNNPLALEFGVKPLPFRAALTRATLESSNSIGCSSVLVRAGDVRSVGGFDEDPELRAVEDYDLWLRLSRCGPLAFVPRIHGYYRVRGESLSREADVSRRAAYLRAKHGLPHPDAAQHRSVVRQTIRGLLHTGVITSTFAAAMTARWALSGHVPVRTHHA